MADIEKSKPEFVTRDGIIADADYVQWLSDVKKRFRESQARATVKVNSEMLEFYWSIGRDLVTLRAESRWGAGVVKQFALDMRETFPDSTGFSYTNVKYMKQWYSFYNERVIKSHQPGGQIEEDEKSHQLGGQLDMPAVFGRVPWRHHVEIFAKCHSLDEALFYINKVAGERGSASSLLALLPAEFTTADLIKLRARKGQSVKGSAISMVLNRWKTNHKIEKVSDTTWRKL